jgi:glycosyltransferase involved in cell wall biosynthesis
VPCYNEEHRIADTVNKLKDFLLKNPGSEVIFVDDGSIDRTEEVIETYKCRNMKIVSLDHNIGKWGAICVGAGLAEGDYCVMCDADYSVDLKILDSIALPYMEDRVVIGNRYHSKNFIPIKRKLPGRIFNMLVRNIAGVKYHDTQTPFKVWSNTENLKKIFSSMIETGFAGDVEFLMRCDKLKVPVAMIKIKYTFVEGSSVSLQKHSLPMFKSLWRIRKYVK